MPERPRGFTLSNETTLGRVGHFVHQFAARLRQNRPALQYRASRYRYFYMATGKAV